MLLFPYWIIGRYAFCYCSGGNFRTSLGPKYGTYSRFYIKSTGFCWILFKTEKPVADLKSSTQFSNRFIMGNWLLSRLGWGIKLMLFIALGNAVKQAWEKASCLWWCHIVEYYFKMKSVSLLSVSVSFCQTLILFFFSFLFYALSILIVLFGFFRC